MSSDCARCLNMIGLGLAGRNLNKKCKQLMLLQWLMFGGVLYIWIRFNGGMWPGFLRSSTRAAVDTKSDILNHFRHEAAGDGLKVTWAHAVNNRARMASVVQGDEMMVEGDVILRGQGTSTQQLVPVMAHPPHTDSDLSLKEWLQALQGRGKGIKLDFKSIESVDLGLQTVAENKDMLKVPVHLSAEVAEGPNNFMAPNKMLDASRFLKQCQAWLPSTTLSLGWTNGYSEEGEQLYTWAMIKTMHDIVDNQQITQPVTYNVRAKLAKNSLTQLKWLTEMTDASLTVFSPKEDKLSSNDILSIRHRFPKDKVFYDIQSDVKQQLEKVPQDGGIDERLKFQVSQWKAVQSKVGEKIYLGSEALMFQNGLLVSKEEFKPQANKPSITINGRVEFLGIPTESKETDSKVPPVGLGVFLRVSQSSYADIISGIRCFIGVTGNLEISTQSIPGVDRKVTAEVPGTLPCFNFKITDFPDINKITAKVTRLKTCNDVVPQLDEDNSVELEFSLKDIDINKYYMAMRAPSSQAFVVVDEFMVL